MCNQEEESICHVPIPVGLSMDTDADESQSPNHVKKQQLVITKSIKTTMKTGKDAYFTNK